MKPSIKKNGVTALNKAELREHILRSMISSFKIEGIEISDSSANEILERVTSKLK